MLFWFQNNDNENIKTSSGAQPEFFQGRGGLMDLGHFYKHFVKNTRKKVLQEKIWEFFLLNTLKITFWMENLTQKWSVKAFFTKSGHFFFGFQNRAG